MRDHGPGFREEDLPFVFDRFHRAKEARSKPGSGLGLAIVRQAAEAHGGSAEASQRAGRRRADAGVVRPQVAIDDGVAPSRPEPTPVRARSTARRQPARGMSYCRPGA